MTTTSLSIGMIGLLCVPSAGQTKRLRPEDLPWHPSRRLGHERPERHAAQDVALQIDTGRYLDQSYPIRRELEDRPLQHVEDPLPARRRPRAAEGHLADVRHELRETAFP